MNQQEFFSGINQMVDQSLFSIWWMELKVYFPFVLIFLASQVPIVLLLIKLVGKANGQQVTSATAAPDLMAEFDAAAARARK